MKLHKRKPIWVAVKDREIEIINHAFYDGHESGKEALEKCFYKYDMIDNYWAEDKSNFFIRITAPFFLLCYVLLFFIIAPIKFLFTGHFYFKNESKFVRFFEVWQKKIGI